MAFVKFLAAICNASGLSLFKELSKIEFDPFLLH